MVGRVGGRSAELVGHVICVGVGLCDVVKSLSWCVLELVIFVLECSISIIGSNLQIGMRMLCWAVSPAPALIPARLSV